MIDDYKPYFTLWNAVICFQRQEKEWHAKPMSQVASEE